MTDHSLKVLYRKLHAMNQVTQALLTKPAQAAETAMNDTLNQVVKAANDSD